MFGPKFIISKAKYVCMCMCVCIASTHYKVRLHCLSFATSERLYTFGALIQFLRLVTKCFRLIECTECE